MRQTAKPTDQICAEVPGDLEPQRLIARLLAALARATPAPDDAEAGAVIEEARRYLAGCA